MSCLFSVIVSIIVITVDSAPKYRRLQNKDSIPDIQSIDKSKAIANDASYSDDYLFDDSIVIDLRSVNETTTPAASDNSTTGRKLSTLNETTVPAASNDSIRINSGIVSETIRALGSENVIRTNLRKLKETSIPAGFDGYIFDENICKEVNGRILCGYDKNKEKYTEATIDDLGNGCNLRGGRIECGYKVKELNNTNTESPNLRENEEPSTETLTVAEKYEVECSKENVRTPDKIQSSDSEHVDSSPLIANKTLPVDMRALHIDVSSEEIVATPDQIQTSTPKSTDSFTSSIALTSITAVETKTSNHEVNKIILEKEVTTPRQMQSITSNTTDARTTQSNESTTTPPTSTVLSSTTISTSSSFKATNSSTVKAEVTAAIPVSTLIDNQNEVEINPEIVYLNETEEEVDHQRPKRHTSDETFETPVTTAIDSYTGNKKFLPSKLKLTEEEASKVKTVCVEQDDRIVCYDLLEE